MSKMIVIDGLDGSGKATQAEILTNTLKAKGYNTYTLDLPFYNDASSTLVKMYLGGEFSDVPGGVNSYAASSFYAVDRFASYKLYWERAYKSGSLILAAATAVRSTLTITKNSSSTKDKKKLFRKLKFLNWRNKNE